MAQTKLSLHPAAKADIDAEAIKLFQEVRSVRVSPQADESFDSEQHVAATITDRDMIGVPKFGDVDFAGRFVSRYFLRDQNTYTLDGEGYQGLRLIADKILKSKEARNLLSKEKLEEVIFNWVSSQFGKEFISSASDNIISQIDDLVDERTVWIPVSNLSVQSDIEFQGGTIRSVTRKMVEEMKAVSLNRAPQHAEVIRSVLDRDLLPIQGYAAVVVTLNAESDYAYDVALRIADTVIALLGIYSVSAVTPWRTYICAVLGSENVPKFQGISFGRDGNFAMKSGIRASQLGIWKLSDIEKHAHIQAGLLDVLALTIEDGLTEFQLRVRSAALTFSRAISSNRMSDRVAQTFSALETLYLKDGSEPIQHSMSERMAFALTTVAEDRKSLIKTIRSAYKLRSQYVHHGISSADEKELEEFMSVAFSAMRLGVDNSHRFDQHSKFLDAIDNVKFGG